MSFEVNHNEASTGGGIIPTGEYEVIIKSAIRLLKRTLLSP